MDPVQVAIKLRRLLIAHDNAVKEILTLDTQVYHLMRKMTANSSNNCIIRGEQLIQRRWVLEGVKEMFTIYRQLKWQEVQACVNAITKDASAESDSEADWNADTSFNDDEASFTELLSDSSYSEDDEDQGDLYSNDSSYDMTTLSRALSVDDSALHRNA
ncbi:uncharacterized protein LOC125377576 [Haliotis rufescens]|uniref:uncharacterized protein LOC124119715 n=1 Tax=Haliotis rufescens TaxID=6454 RepID=UPI001EB07A2B|nr:uncharacterized protein LOC124119715 [Haliotis rufescens]XP_046338450.2 uncharacterized protein LOC124119838 [Haliotis rufescens]XP_046338477.1 uncharacterized protein LOC124119860 [Haliotis rufescens]XP_048246298.1 uncharacterized protein LOC125377316 [Haliotis rufescens]XP_048246300.1 uncharacterized protein LOC125377317 [Haliotis rufescens]XP_048246301.1 uncharacterized protein LOC125377318 [Haliotis rufescens]XP_048246302.1 uncharacterized protein LOC124119837 [Haliotis rufescens]XP_0